MSTTPSHRNASPPAADVAAIDPNQGRALLSGYTAADPLSAPPPAARRRWEPTRGNRRGDFVCPSFATFYPAALAKIPEIFGAGGYTVTDSLRSLVEVVARGDLSEMLTRFETTRLVMAQASAASSHGLMNGLQLLDRLLLASVMEQSIEQLQPNPERQFTPGSRSEASTTTVGVSVLHGGTTKSQQYYSTIPTISEQLREGLTYVIGDQRFDQFARAVSALSKGVKCPVRRYILVHYLSGACISMCHYTRLTDTFKSGNRDCAQRYLTSVRDYLAPLFDTYKGTRVPVHELLGSSGIGKSVAVMNLRWLVRSLVPHISLGDVVYTRARDRWWNGYRGQPIVLYDDVTHMDPKKAKFDLASEIIDIASGTLDTIPMAFEKDMQFCSVAAFITSNIPLMSAPKMAEETRTALSRRVTTAIYAPVIKAIFDPERMKFLFKGFMMSAITSGRTSLLSSLGDLFEVITAADALFVDNNYTDVPIESDLLPRRSSWTPTGSPPLPPPASLTLLDIDCATMLTTDVGEDEDDEWEDPPTTSNMPAAPSSRAAREREEARTALAMKIPERRSYSSNAIPIAPHHTASVADFSMALETEKDSDLWKSTAMTPEAAQQLKFIKDTLPVQYAREKRLNNLGCFSSTKLCSSIIKDRRVQIQRLRELETATAEALYEARVSALTDDDAHETYVQNRKISVEYAWASLRLGPIPVLRWTYTANNQVVEL